MTFERGQRVVCVDADGAPQLKLKAIYTIKNIMGPYYQNWRGAARSGFSVLLQEADPHEVYTGFAAERFQPVWERPTDISVFREMLLDTPVDA